MAISPRRRAGRSRLTIVLLVLTTVTVLTLDFRGSSFVDELRHTVGSGLAPLQGVAGFAATPFENMWNGITDYGDLAGENAELRQRVDDLEGRLAQNEDLAVQYDALLDQLDIPWVGDVPTATAEVVQQPVTSFSHVVIIDKGSSSGIKVGMPVVNGAGLVGRVVDVDRTRSSVQLVTDPEFRVGVRLVTSGEVGTARGRGAGVSLAVDTGIEPELVDDLVPSLEIVTTAGSEDDRSSFPASIPVGRVVATALAGNGLTIEVDVEPLADLNQLSYVDVLLLTPVE